MKKRKRPNIPRTHGVTPIGSETPAVVPAVVPVATNGPAAISVPVEQRDERDDISGRHTIVSVPTVSVPTETARVDHVESATGDRVIGVEDRKTDGEVIASSSDTKTAEARIGDAIATESRSTVEPKGENRKRRNGNPFGKSPSVVTEGTERRVQDRRKKPRVVAMDHHPSSLPAPVRRPLPSPNAGFFDQDVAWAALPDDYERPRELSMHKAWQLPAPFDRIRLGLRARATLAFALGALLISVLVSSLTYIVARTGFVASRTEAVQRLAFSNAVLVQTAYVSPGSRSVKNVVLRQARADAISVFIVDPETARPGVKSKPIVYSSAQENDFTIPPSIDAALQRSHAARQIVLLPQGRRLVVCVRLDGLGRARFCEIADLAEVEDQMQRLGRTLALAALVSALGAALVGRSVSARVVRPLRNVANAAADIANGRLDTRIQRSGDPDLDPLLNSFNGMAQSLQARLEREARFASDVSHELRTPLTVLSTAAQLLKGRRDEMPERSQRAVDLLVTQTEHFERLVLDLLEISRFDAGAAELNREILDLPEFVRQVVAINTSLNLDGEPNPRVPVDDSELSEHEVMLDKRRVERIVANLLQNAANYGGGATGVLLADESIDGQRGVRITVEDAGPGVPDDEKASIFERFRRGKAHLRGTSAPKGTGLGLALVAAHAVLHNGRVWVEDRPGGGARFIAVLAVGANDDEDGDAA